jgi:hypothetical protein
LAPSLTELYLSTIMAWPRANRQARKVLIVLEEDACCAELRVLKAPISESCRRRDCYRAKDRTRHEGSHAAISALIGDHEALKKHLDLLRSDSITNRVRALLAMEPRTRHPVFSTAAQALQWCDDPWPQRLSNLSTFNFEDFCRDPADYSSPCQRNHSRRSHL